MAIDTSEVLIWSADVKEPVLDDILFIEGLPLRYIKLDRVGLTRMGLPKIHEVQERGFKVFADAKIAEITVKVIELAKLHLEYRPWMLNIMADCWSTDKMQHTDENKVDALKRFADLCLKSGTFPCAVTVLTNTTPEVASQQFNGRTAVEQVLVYAEVLVRAGFTDLVCSPLEVAAIRSESVFDNLKLNTPGIRLADTSSDDQARTNTPAGAMKNGSDRLVVGRNLTNGDILENYKRIADDLAALAD